jgi:hypothetical protein
MGDVPRALGETLSISVATAMALEKLLTTDTTKGHSVIQLNVKTLFRNMYGSYTKENVPSITAFANSFYEEIQQIQSIISDSLPGKIHPIFYVATHKSLGKCFPDANLRITTAPARVNYEAYEARVYERIYKLTKGNLIVGYDTLIKGNNVSALILTHHPVDLLSYYTFRKLTLIESHTGVIKGKTEWITKLTKKDEYRNIPFNSLAVQVYGDNGNLINPLSVKIREHFAELGTAKTWSAVTTLAKQQFDIRNMKDRPLADLLIKMSTVKLI